MTCGEGKCKVRDYTVGCREFGLNLSMKRMKSIYGQGFWVYASFFDKMVKNHQR